MPGAAVGRAGGAACGDRLEISLRLRGRTRQRPAAERLGLRGRPGRGRRRRRAGRTASRSPPPPCSAPPTYPRSSAASARSGTHAADLAAEALHRALGAAAATAEQPLLSPPERGERVLVAVSGGVDSAVAALRERERGAEVLAVTLELWSDPANDGERSCCSADAVRQARAVSHSLGIPHLTVDLRDRFRAGVVEPFLEGYAAGRTPNPCVRCNGRVRIEPMIALAGLLGASALATGHYARLVDDDGEPLLAAAADPAKDQAYMLAGLRPQALRQLRFPLGELTKPRVRELARDAGLPVADKAESQDLCFLAGEGKAGFLARHGGLADRPGEIVAADGEVLGEHPGHHRFTVGQRKGIGLGAPEPLYVLSTDARTNRVVVGPGEALQTERVAVRDAVLHRPAARVRSVRLRYRSQPVACRVGGDGGPGNHESLTVELDAPVRAAAPGQTAVFCDGDVVVGHGTIA